MGAYVISRPQVWVLGACCGVRARVDVIPRSVPYTVLEVAVLTGRRM